MRPLISLIAMVLLFLLIARMSWLEAGFVSLLLLLLMAVGEVLIVTPIHGLFDISFEQSTRELRYQVSGSWLASSLIVVLAGILLIRDRRRQMRRRDGIGGVSVRREGVVEAEAERW